MRISMECRGETKLENERFKLLIVDDAQVNREILADILGDEFDILEAENGREALDVIEAYGNGLACILLDMVMPVMNGIEVVEAMNEKGWLEDIPVIMISAENYPKFIAHLFDLGVTDFINRPFDAKVVHKRVINTVLLYAKQKRLTEMVASQIIERTQSTNMLINVLSHIVEFRNGESGSHCLNISKITALLLRGIMSRTDEYGLTRADIPSICTASSLHDIGKIAIPDEVINKPGKLTDEEFAIMKAHSMEGFKLLETIPNGDDIDVISYAKQIARHHHEKYDGRGYPDGLKGEEIPIAAQIVSLADVYDALTSERCYKKAFTHEKAIEMIVNGECGAFNPILLQCFLEIAPTLQDQLQNSSLLEEQAAEDLQYLVSTMLETSKIDDQIFKGED